MGRGTQGADSEQAPSVSPPTTEYLLRASFCPKPLPLSSHLILLKHTQGWSPAPATTQGTESQHPNFNPGITTPLAQGCCEEQMESPGRNVLANPSGSTPTNGVCTVMITMESHTSPENQTVQPRSER